MRVYGSLLCLAVCLASPCFVGNEPAATQAATQAASDEFVAKPRPTGAFQLLDGDRVIFLGDTFIERAQSNDYIETRLTARYPARNITFRNLGWSGDTVFGDARAGFGTPADGFQQLKRQVYALKPTVIFVSYGANSSFDGEAGLPRFITGLNNLLDVLRVTRAHIFLLSPLRHEDLGRPLPDPAVHNQQLRLYRDAIKHIAAERVLPFLDLFELIAMGGNRGPHLTDNGIHLTDYGYAEVAGTIAQSLGSPPPAWDMELNLAKNTFNSVGTKISQLATFAGGVSFHALDSVLPDAVLAAERIQPLANDAAPAFTRKLEISQLPPGNYRLLIDGKEIVAASAADWDKGVNLTTGPEFDQVELLRKTIIAKNRLYFYRWRPQNETYLFGFRKHEQGQNAKDIPLFDPLVAEQEAAIARLRKPVPHLYEIVPEK